MHVNSNMGSLSLTRESGQKAIAQEMSGREMCLLPGRVTENANNFQVSLNQYVDATLFLTFMPELQHNFLITNF